jgi:hypothetical protein
MKYRFELSIGKYLLFLHHLAFFTFLLYLERISANTGKRSLKGILIVVGKHFLYREEGTSSGICFYKGSGGRGLFS